MPDAEGMKDKFSETEISGEEYTDSHRSATTMTCSTIPSNVSLTLERNDETACREESGTTGNHHPDNTVSFEAAALSVHGPSGDQCIHLEATPPRSQDRGDVTPHALHSVHASFIDATSASKYMPQPPDSPGCVLDQAGQVGQGDSAKVSLGEVHHEGVQDDKHCDQRIKRLHASDIQCLALQGEHADTNLPAVRTALPEERLPFDGPDTVDENHQPPDSHDDEDPLVQLHHQHPPCDHSTPPAQHLSDRTDQHPAGQDDLVEGLALPSSTENSSVGSVAEDIECSSESAGDCGDGTSWSAGIAPDGVYCKPCHMAVMIALHLDVLSYSGRNSGGTQHSIVFSGMQIPTSHAPKALTMHAVATKSQHVQSAPGAVSFPEAADMPCLLPIPADNSPKQIVRSIGGGPTCPSLCSDASSAFTVEYEDEDDDLEFGHSFGDSSSDREASPQSSHAPMDQDAVFEWQQSTGGVDVCSRQLGLIPSDSVTEGVHSEDASGSITNQPELQVAALGFHDIKEAMGGLDAAEVILDMPFGGPGELGEEIESFEESDDGNDANSDALGCIAGEYVALGIGVNMGAQVWRA